MSGVQVTALGGPRTSVGGGGSGGDASLRAPPQVAGEYQRERSREEIELAESLLDHRQGPRETVRIYAQEQQQQQQQHSSPNHSHGQGHSHTQGLSQGQQHQHHYMSSSQQQQQPSSSSTYYAASDDRRNTHATEAPRIPQSSNHQNDDSSLTSTYPLHPRPVAAQGAAQTSSSSSLPATPTSQAQAGSANGQYCSNCGTTKTPLWRRSQLGQTICNACGLYEKARNTSRPPNLKRPPSYAPTFSASPGLGEPEMGNAASGNVLMSAESQPCQGTCPGDGKCNGTGGHAACDGCPAFNNRVSKTAQMALHQSQRLSPGGSVRSEQVHAEAARPAGENVVVACQNCHTTTTPLWRRDMDGHTICNACGLYYKLHGQHRPVEMKKTFIKRRKRVAPALGGQGFAQNVPNAASTSPMSTSPESSAAYPATPGQQQDGPEHSWTARNHSRNPVEPPVNIDPTLDRSHHPPPVDFTQYPQRQASDRSGPRPHSIYPAHPLPASPKRRRSPAPVEQAPHPSSQVQDDEGAQARHLPRPLADLQRGDRDNSSPTADGVESEESRRYKRLKREELKAQMRRMQQEIDAMGGSDTE